MLPFSLLNFTVLFISYSSTYLLSWLISFSVTLCSTWSFKRISIYRDSDATLSNNEVRSKGSQYSPTPLQYVNVISASSYIPHYHTDAFKDSIVYGFFTSSSPVGILDIPFLFLTLPFLSVSPSYLPPLFFNSGLPAPQC